jgi:hypothetical protein
LLIPKKKFLLTPSITMAKQKKGINFYPFLKINFEDINSLGPSERTRNTRRQATPPPIIPTKQPEEQLSGISRVNKEIASLIARKDPVLNRVVKKPKARISRQKKERMEVKMIKAAAKAV